MTDKQNFEKDINVPSKRLDYSDKIHIELANYEQMERDIEKIIEPYQLDWELDCLSLPSAIQSILERKEQECEEWKEKLTKSIFEDGIKQIVLHIAIYERDKFKQTLAEIKKIAEYTIDMFDEGLETGGTYDRVEQILQKISECEGNDK